MRAMYEVLPLDRLTGIPAATWKALAAVFRQHAYDESIVLFGEAVLGNTVDAFRLPLAQAALERRGDPAALLALLFSYRASVPEPRAREVLTAPLLETFREAGLLVVTPDGVESRVRILPFEAVWVLSDELDQPGDPVMGPGRTTSQLATALGRSTGSVLDVGCGAGSLALVAKKRGAARVVAVDLSERAVALTRINAQLNDLEIEARAGDLFAPVEGERFDVVVAQPPFVIHAPGEDALTFLHGGADGDELALRLLHEVPAYLAPEGRALVILQSPVRTDETLAARITRVLGSPRLSLALSVLGYFDPDQEAAVTASMTRSGRGDYARAARAHRAALDARGITRVVQALAEVRAGYPQPFTATFRWKELRALTAELLEETWAAARAAGAPDPALLENRLRARPGCRVVMSQALDEVGEPPQKLTLTFPHGAVSDQEVSADVVSLIQALDGSETVAEAIEAFAADPVAMRGPVLGMVRRLLMSGVLVEG